MNCLVRNCAAPAYLAEPLPLCEADALRVAQALASKALKDLRHGEADQTAPYVPAEAEINTLKRLIHTEGWNAIDLNRAMAVLHRPKATAARRLNAARKGYAADITRRAHRDSV